MRERRILKRFLLIPAVAGLLALSGCSSFDRMRSAAENGEPAAQYELAEYYRSGDPALSVLWMTRAAENGYPKAMVELGKFHLDGFGVQRDRDAALGWWEKAALGKGDLEAAQLLGELLLPDPPPGRAELAVAAYGVLLADPACEERRKFAAKLLDEGGKLRAMLKLADRREELAAVEKRFTRIFRESADCFDLSDPKVLESMDRLSDEFYLLPPLAGKPPAPTEVSGLRPEFAALLGAGRGRTDNMQYRNMFRIATRNAVQRAQFADAVSGQQRTGPFDARIAVSGICRIQLVGAADPPQGAVRDDAIEKL